MPSGSCPSASGGPSTPSTPSAGWWTTAWTSRAAREKRACGDGRRKCSVATKGARPPTWGATLRRPCSSFPSLAAASRTSSPVAGWTSRRRATRPSPACASTASGSPRRWAWPPSRSSSTRTRGRGSTRSSWGWPCSSPTSCGTSPPTRPGPVSTCRRKISPASESAKPSCWRRRRAATRRRRCASCSHSRPPAPAPTTTSRVTCCRPPTGRR